MAHKPTLCLGRPSAGKCNANANIDAIANTNVRANANAQGKPVALSRPPAMDGQGGWFVVRLPSTDEDGWLYGSAYDRLQHPRPGKHGARWQCGDRPTVRGAVWRVVGCGAVQGYAAVRCGAEQGVAVEGVCPQKQSSWPMSGLVWWQHGVLCLLQGNVASRLTQHASDHVIAHTCCMVVWHQYACAHVLMYTTLMCAHYAVVAHVPALHTLPPLGRHAVVVSCVLSCNGVQGGGPPSA